MAPTAFLEFDWELHGSPPNQANAQRMWMDKARLAITALQSQYADPVIRQALQAALDGA